MSARLMEYLQGRGVTFVVIPHPDDPAQPDRDNPTASSGRPSLVVADERRDPAPRPTRPRGFAPDEVVKTEVLVTSLGHALMVVPETTDLDLDLARAALRDPDARPAATKELERSFPEYEPGALPPLGLFFLAPMYVDPAVVQRSTVVFRAGKHTLSIAMATDALFRDDPVVITPLTAASAAAASDTETG
ncbi:MAG: YbaK/EbsC family protein [Actinomycetota bacterium]